MMGGANVSKALDRSGAIRKALTEKGIDTRPLAGGALPGGLDVPFGEGVNASIATHDFVTAGQFAEILI